MTNLKKNKTICVVGLGYVGLPLALEFGKYRNVIGFDIDADRISQLKRGFDSTDELSHSNFKESSLIKFSDSEKDLNQASIFIVTVPTPVDSLNQPDLSPLGAASKMIARHMPQGSIVIYESTVFPGATEDYCIPILEKYSNKKYNKDFFCGYSPERINPGDKTNRLIDIVKVTSGSTPKIATEVDNLYKEIIRAGTHKVSSIKVAEASKVIENTQRDLNIALMNELSIIFEKMDINTLEVIEAASTKWNFIPFKPGLVGGHCIGVDPYYLTFKAQQLGYTPEVILAGRKVNNLIVESIAQKTIMLLIKRDIPIRKSKVLIMGFTFKENCKDVRNTKVWDLYKNLQGYGASIDVHEPLLGSEDLKDEFGIKNVVAISNKRKYDAIIIAVGHTHFKDLGIKNIKKYGTQKAAILDIKSIFRDSKSDFSL